MNNEQQPVAWWNPTKDTVSTDPTHRNNPDCVPLYTAPQDGVVSKLFEENQRLLAELSQAKKQEPSYWLGYGLKVYYERPFQGATPLYTAPPQSRERIIFPTMLRRMWSGSEVQQWLDENVNGGKHEPKPNQDICGND